MKHSRCRWVAGAVLAMCLLALPPGIAQTAAETPQQEEAKANVLITFRLGRIEGGQRIPVKSYDLVVAAGTLGSKLLSGERVPFPSAASDGSGGGEATKAFVYQNVGFASEARAWILDKKKIKLVAEIEDSRVRESAEGYPPTVETRQLNISAILTDGVPLELTRVEGVTDQSGFVEVEARILR